MSIIDKKEFVRKSCVAGRFYPASKAALGEMVSTFMDAGAKQDALAVIAPHAGYVYSGPTAGRVLSSINIPDRIILLGPNHTGMGTPASVMPSGVWESPGGPVEVDDELASMVLASSPLFHSDVTAHLMEHSLEVMLPFVHAANPSARIVPVTIMQADLKECEEMGKALAKVVSSVKDKTLILVSSDMNHYEPENVTRAKDKSAIEKVTALDAKGLLDVADKLDITMCGIIPTAIAICAAKALGATTGRLVSYTTSGEVNGELNSVVGYAGIIID